MSRSGGDDPKRVILARRAKFVAAALAGLAACDPKPGEPQVCLEPVFIPPADANAPTAPDAGARIEDAGPIEPPMPCLSPVAVDYDAGAAEPPRPCLSVRPTPFDAGRPAKADAGPVAPPPHVCLSPVRPKPQVCLSVAPTFEDKDLKK